MIEKKLLYQNYTIMNKKKQSGNKCPAEYFFYLPILQAIESLGGSASIEEIYKKVIELTQLPNEVIDEMHSYKTKVEYRLGWARTALKNYGAIERSKQGVWALTVKGAQILKNGNFDPKEIKKTISKKQINTESTSEYCNYEKRDWREQTSEILQNLDPYAFERLAQRLLRECGFSDVEVTKKSGDGGIDGTGKLRINGIFSFNVAFQCKRYKGQVGAPPNQRLSRFIGNEYRKGSFDYYWFVYKRSKRRSVQ